MTKATTTALRRNEMHGSAGAPWPSRARASLLAPVVLLFVGSGAAALIYEVVWLQLLSLVIGSSAISLGLLLATFMAGMCIGSLGLPYVISRRRHPLRVYAALELGIAAFGVLVLMGIPLLAGLYASIGGAGAGGLVLRATLAALCLLPPTILMGATLPAISRWVEATPKGVSWLGFFYGGNIVGAVVGSLLAGFYLLRLYDMTTATLVAMALNVLVAGAAFALAAVSPHDAPPEPASPKTGSRLAKVLPSGAWPVLVAIGLSGMTALAAEVVWARILSLALGATVYTFSLILGAFLAGLGIGSGMAAYFAPHLDRPRLALGVCQFLLMGALAWAAYVLTRAMPYWPIDPSISTNAWFNFQLDFIRASLTVVPGALLWGASFPLALAALAERPNPSASSADASRSLDRSSASPATSSDTGKLVGVVYAVNTLGAILGSLLAALLLIGTLGTQSSQRIFIALAGVSALLLLALEVRDSGRQGLRRSAPAWVGVVGVAALLLGWSVSPVPGVLIGYGRFAATWVGYHGDFIYTGEGTHASLAVSETRDGVRRYHNAGKVQASSLPEDMRLQRMLGHLTTLVPEDPRSVLVIGFGAGVTAGAVSLDPRVEDLTIAEIERLVPGVVSTYFSQENFNVARNPKTTLVVDDARHFLLTTDKTYDAITSDPFDPWVKGAATLYTAEFFELMKQRLNPGGVVTIFVQLYESGLDAVKSEIATFTQAFPNSVVWANTHEGEGYDVVLMGQVEPTRIDVEELDRRLALPEYLPITRSLEDAGFRSLDDLLDTYIASADDLRPWLADAQITTDRNLRLGYLAGMALNRREADLIYREMASHGSFPGGLFVAPSQRVDRLREVISSEQAQARLMLGVF